MSCGGGGGGSDGMGGVRMKWQWERVSACVREWW